MKEHTEMEMMCEHGLAALKKALEEKDYKRIDELAYDTALFLKELKFSKERVFTGLAMDFSLIKDGELTVNEDNFEKDYKTLERMLKNVDDLNGKAQTLDNMIEKLKKEGKPVNCILDYMHITDLKEITAATAELAGKEKTEHYIQ